MASDEPRIGAGVLIGAIVASLLVSFTVTESKSWLKPRPQTSAPRFECPMPTVNEKLVVIVAYTEQHTIQTTCSIVMSRGQRKREGL